MTDTLDEKALVDAVAQAIYNTALHGWEHSTYSDKKRAREKARKVLAVISAAREEAGFVEVPRDSIVSDERASTPSAPPGGRS